MTDGWLLVNVRYRISHGLQICPPHIQLGLLKYLKIELT